MVLVLVLVLIVSEGEKGKIFVWWVRESQFLDLANIQIWIQRV
jgi:hypothetical protein